MNSGKITDQGCVMEQIYGCMTSVDDEKIDECHVLRQSELNVSNILDKFHLSRKHSNISSS